MKKLSLILVIAIIISSLTVVASEVIELPKVPITSSNVKIKLSSDAASSVPVGSVVNFNTEITPDAELGVKSVALSYQYTDTLIFNDDVTISGLPSGWRAVSIKDNGETLSFTVSNFSGNAPIKTVFSIQFSFTVSDEPNTDNSVTFSTVKIVNSEGDTEKNVQKSYRYNTFKSKSVTPYFENIGASLRINNVPTLRFGMRIEKDDIFGEVFGYDYSSNDNMKFGIVSINKNSLSGELTVETKGARVKITETPFLETSNEVVFVDTLESFPTNTTEYVFRPFVKYLDGKGEEQYYYGEVKTRSAEYVASAELKSTVDQKKKELLNKFID